MKTIHPRKQSGSSLIVVISVMATLMILVGVVAEYTWTVNRHVQRSSTLQGAVAVGDACLEILFANWRATCSAAPTTLQTTSAFAAVPTPSPGQLNLPSTTNFVRRGTSFDPANDEYFSDYTISNYKIVAVTPEWTALASATTPPMPILGPVALPTPAPSPTTTLVYNYIASADVTLPALGPSGNVVAKVRRVFQKQQMSPWNFAIFYVDPLEIHPGPAFTVTGWVHTNSDLYTGHNSLTFADKVTYGSDWSVGFHPLDGTHDNDDPAAPNYPGNLPPARDQAMQPFGLDATSIFSTADANPNNDSYRELIEQATAGYTDPLAGQRYYDQAAIRVSIDASNNVTIRKLNGATVSATSAAGSNDLKLYTAITNALSTNQTIWNGRENATVRLATLDVGRIVTSLNNSTSSSDHIASSLWNGIMYITDTSAGSGVSRGIRLKNGQVLPAGGFTVASANPVYVQGDYNTGIGTVPSNLTGTSNDPTRPQASDASGNPLYTRVPSSVVADAVTILSNSWNDSNGNSSGDPLSGRVATNTTVNTAIIAGIVPSGGLPVNGVSPQDRSYSGGAENFPRFLENWDNKSFTYYGSMVELFQSKQAIGEWSYGGNVYNAPKRQWYFDNTFRTTPPPGSIMLYSYIKGKWSVL